MTPHLDIRTTLLWVLSLSLSLTANSALADPHEQAQRAASNPGIELLDAADLQYLEAFTAPGIIFHESLCSPPRTNINVLCTQLPLDHNVPFTDFPVALRFYDGADAKSVARDRISSRRGDQGIEAPHFFLLGISHGKVDIKEGGGASYSSSEPDTIPALKAGEHYRSNLRIAVQGRAGFLNFHHRVVVPKGVVLYRSYPLGPLDTERKWRKCDGEIVSRKLPSGWMHRYGSGGNCGARYAVNVFGERSQREVTAYVFRHTENFHMGPRYRNLSQTLRISSKDLPGLYTFEWWYAGKLLTRTRFEVKA